MKHEKDSLSYTRITHGVPVKMIKLYTILLDQPLSDIINLVTLMFRYFKRWFKHHSHSNSTITQKEIII